MVEVFKSEVLATMVTINDPGLEIKLEYTGKSMFADKKCLGLVGSHTEAIVFLYELASRRSLARFGSPHANGWFGLLKDEFYELLSCPMQTDSLGYDTIWYWPDIQVTTEEETE